MASALLLSPARGQSCDGEWLPGGAVRGVSGTVYAQCVWDPDGDGPRAPVLVVGGTFTAAGSIAVNRIVAWDGEAWSSLGDGFDGTVTALCVFQGKLIASGSFGHSGPVEAKGIAAWNGETWETLGGGLTRSASSMVEAGGMLYVAGNISEAGGVAVRNIAVWNGTQWNSVGNEWSLSSWTLCEYQGSVVGVFSGSPSSPGLSLKRWNGSAWVALGGNLIGPATRPAFVGALYSRGDDLIVAGTLFSAGGVPVANCAAWNGTAWRAMGTGLGAGMYSASLFEYQGKLHAFGRFGTGAIYRLDGEQWNAISSIVVDLGIAANATVFRESIVAGGNFSMMYGLGSLDYSENVAGWNGEWFALGNGALGGGQLTTAHGAVYGTFSPAPDGMPTAGSVVKWNGARWTDLPRIAEGPGFSLFAIQGVHDRLFASWGQLDGNVLFTSVSEWDGERWIRIPGVIRGTVAALTMYKGDLVVGGNVSSINGEAISRIARWDGNSWQGLGSGMNGEVRAFVVDGDELIAAGGFTTAGGTPAAHVASWDGVQWRAFGSGIDDPGTSYSVNALCVHEGELYVGGSFGSIGGVPTPGVARWDGSGWNSLGGEDFVTTVGSLCSFNGDLVAGGNFTGSPVGNIARWDGTAWKEFGAGVNAYVAKVVAYRGELLASGSFTTADTKPSAHFARWVETAKPWIAEEPGGRAVNEGLRLTLRATVASGYSGVSFVWQRDGVELEDGAGGASASGGFVSGARGVLASPTTGASTVLTIDGVAGSDSGEYRVVFLNDCGEAISESAAVDVRTCPCDISQDGLVDDADFGLFVLAYDLMLCDDAMMSSDCLADFNGDGVVDDGDFSVFVRAYDALVCE